MNPFRVSDMARKPPLGSQWNDCLVNSGVTGGVQPTPRRSQTAISVEHGESFHKIVSDPVADTDREPTVALTGVVRPEV